MAMLLVLWETMVVITNRRMRGSSNDADGTSRARLRWWHHAEPIKGGSVNSRSDGCASSGLECANSGRQGLIPTYHG